MYQFSGLKSLRMAFWVVALTMYIVSDRPVIPAKAQTPIPGVVPYTVVLKETVIDPQGNIRPATTQIMALRSDGAIMIQSGAAEDKRTILFPTGEEVQTVPKSAMKTTIFRKLDLRNRIIDPTSSCTKNLNGKALSDSITVLQEELISGHRSVKLSSGSSTQWRALDCGCALLQLRIEFGRGGSMEQRLVSLTKGEPDPSLFTVPSHYQEVKPSVAICGGECPPGKMNEEFLKRLDRDYETGGSGSFSMGSSGPASQGTGVGGNSRFQITYKERAQYTKEARENNVRGTVVVRALFHADGTISDITIVRGLPHGLNEKAIEAAQKIRFRPAVKDGKPVTVSGILEFTFDF